MTRKDAVLLCERITTPLILPDNRLGKCCECGWRVQFRPHAPKSRKMCRQCARDLIPPDTEVLTTRRMLEDFLDYVKRGRQ